MAPRNRLEFTAVVDSLQNSVNSDRPQQADWTAKISGGRLRNVRSASSYPKPDSSYAANRGVSIVRDACDRLEV